MIKPNNDRQTVLIAVKLPTQFCVFKDTHKEKAQSNKTPAFGKNTNMGIWAVGTINQLVIRGS